LVESIATTFARPPAIPIAVADSRAPKKSSKRR
jgi:hypothetical protein